MDIPKKNESKSQALTGQQVSLYNPWNLFFNSRRRTESESSAASSTSSYSDSTYGGHQRQPSKSNEEYLWMIEFISARMSRMRLRCATRHPTTRRRTRTMDQHSLRIVCLLVVGVLSEPAPGRVPKVYNALITSNQNLEPSKAYPVYQPVLHDTAFGFPYQPVFYGSDYPINNGLFPPQVFSPKDAAGPTQPPQLPQPPQPPVIIPEESKPSLTESPPASTPQPPSEPSPDNNKSTPAPPPPPNTQSPIPLNQFGLPPQVLPLGRIDPAYNGFTQVGPYSYTYSYPGVRFYDPYDPFSFNPYANLPPLFRPFGNGLSPSPPEVGKQAPPDAPPEAQPEDSTPGSPQPPYSDTSNLSVLNYSSKDPNIPDVQPPPLPQGARVGKSDDSN